MHRAFLLLLLVLPLPAGATPIIINHAGRLLGTDGRPVSGSMTLKLVLFDAKDATAAIWFGSS